MEGIAARPQERVGRAQRPPDVSGPSGRKPVMRRFSGGSTLLTPAGARLTLRARSGPDPRNLRAVRRMERCPQPSLPLVSAWGETLLRRRSRTAEYSSHHPKESS